MLDASRAWAEVASQRHPDRCTSTHTCLLPCPARTELQTRPEAQFIDLLRLAAQSVFIVFGILTHALAVASRRLQFMLCMPKVQLCYRYFMCHFVCPE